MNESKPPIGIYPVATVRDVAESLHIDRLSEETCQAIAGDVEFRLSLVIQEATKFMRHAKRTTMVPSDIEYALKALNVQPTLQPAHPLYKPQFASVYPPSDPSASTQQLYYLKDEEIDLGAYLKGAHTLPAATAAGGPGAGVRWKAHWLAVEGVQPLIPENPISRIRESNSLNLDGNLNGAPVPPPTGHTLATSSNQILAKAHLSQELQLLFQRLTEALVPDPSLQTLISGSQDAQPGPSTLQSRFSKNEESRQAALATIRSDPSLADLLPYLVRWLTENITAAIQEQERTTVEISYLLDGLVAVTANEHLYIEPYLHQFLPAILSVLLINNLPTAAHSTQNSNSTPQDVPTVPLRQLKRSAQELLRHVCARYADEYDTLVPRIARLLCRSLSDPPHPAHQANRGLSEPSAGSKYVGALLGLQALGRQAARGSLLKDEGRLLGIIGDRSKVFQGQAKSDVENALLESLSYALEVPSDQISKNGSESDAAAEADVAMADASDTTSVGRCLTTFDALRTTHVHLSRAILKALKSQ